MSHGPRHSKCDEDFGECQCDPFADTRYERKKEGEEDQ